MRKLLEHASEEAASIAFRHKTRFPMELETITFDYNFYDISMCRVSLLSNQLYTVFFFFFLSPKVTDRHLLGEHYKKTVQCKLTLHSFACYTHIYFAVFYAEHFSRLWE